MPLYLNGQYWGLYRWMPPKDKEWLKRLSDCEAVDVLEGPAAVARSGSDAHFKPAVALLMEMAPMDTLARYFDLDNLTDLACMDLWTGRADHDLNVRLYRPRQHGGRWRWVMYDMDLWAPADENSVERMASGTAAETPYIPQFLKHPELQPKLLARMSALLATALSPAHAAALADSLYASHKTAMYADHERWKEEMEQPEPALSHAELRSFIMDRPTHLTGYLSEATGRKQRKFTVEAPTAEQGILRIEGLVLRPGVHEITGFSGAPMRLEFAPVEGYELSGWKGDGSTGSPILIDPARVRSVRPLVRLALP